MAKLKDKLINLVSGLNTSGDKQSHSRDVFVELPETALAQMYAGNWIHGTVIDDPIDQALRRSREISAASLDDQIQQFEKATEGSRKSLHMRVKTKKLFKWSRLFGGAAAVVGVDGQGENSDPLVIEKIKRGDLKFIHILPRHKISIQRMDTDINSPTFDEPLMYSIAGEVVHASRVYPVKGIELPDDLTTSDKYWGMSILQRTEEPTKQLGTVLAQLTSMTYEANVDIISVKGLRHMLGTPDGRQKAIDRFKLANILKSTQQLMLIDGDSETYDRKKIDIGRFPDLIMPYVQLVAGASQIPATRFLSKSPDGQNSTGEGDEDNYLNTLESIREEGIDPWYEWIDPIILMSTFGHVPEDWGYSWPDFHQMDAKEQSEIEKIDSDTDDTQLAQGIINEGHVADRVFRSGRYPSMTEDDVSEVQAAVKLAKETPPPTFEMEEEPDGETDNQEIE